MKKRFSFRPAFKNCFAVKSTILIVSVLFLNACVSTTPGKKEMEDMISMAETASKKEDYENAARSYIKAIIAAELADPNKVHSLNKELSQNYIEWSRSIYWKAKSQKSPELYEKAIYICEKALEANPKYKVKCGVYISKFKKELASLKYKNDTSIKTLLPRTKEKNYKIAVLYKQGEVLRKTRKYMRAKEKFEEILILDPFNIDASRQIRKIMKTVDKIGRKRREADETAKMAEVQWKYVEPIAAKEEAMEVARRDVEAGTLLQSKLAACSIQKLNFNDTPLQKAFKDLKINIADAIQSDFKFVYKGFSPSEYAPVTFQAENIPADDAIEEICNAFKLFPTYSTNSVIIERKPD